MRPLELTLEGFRSYRSPVTFDWRGPPARSASSGRSGPGKSSILDAVAFALYGKTPGIAQDTKSLIHQLCDQAHVALTFEVDGQVWKAVRAPKRKGQSGHQLVPPRGDDAGRRDPGDRDAGGPGEREGRAAAGHGLRDVLPVGAAGPEPVQRIPEGHPDRAGQGAEGCVRLRAARRREAGCRAAIGSRGSRAGSVRTGSARPSTEARGRLEARSDRGPTMLGRI